MAYSNKSWTSILPRDTQTRPHVEIAYNADALRGNASSSPKAIGIIGQSENGKPNTVYRITSLSQAKSTFGSGELFDAISLAWSPNENIYGAGGVIYAMRIEDANPSTLDAGSFQFKSIVYGEQANNISVALEKNEINDSYRVTVQDDSDSYRAVYDNLGKMINIQRTLNDTTNGSAKVSVEHNSKGYATKLTISVKDADSQTSQKSGETKSSDLVESVAEFNLQDSRYDNIFKLANGISLLPNTSVQIVNETNNDNIKSILLDEVKDLDISKDIDSSDSATLWAVAGDIVSKLQYDDRIEVVADISKGLPKEFGATYLTGGKTGSAPISWYDKFQNFNQVPVYYLVALTGSASVHAELAEYIADQYSQEHNVRGFVGGGFGESVKQLINRQVQLNNDRMALVGTSGYFTTQDGRSLQVPSYMVASMVAGIASSLAIGGSVTNKEIALTSLDKNYSSAELDTLNSNGIIMISPLLNRGMQSSFRINDDVTTHQNTDDPTKTEIGLGEVTDFLFDDLRFYLHDNFIGQSISALSSSTLASAVDQFLDGQKASKDGYVTDYDPDSIYVEITGNSAYILFDFAPTRTLKLIKAFGTFANYTSESTGNGTNSSSTVDSSGSVVSGNKNGNDVENDANNSVGSKGGN